MAAWLDVAAWFDYVAFYAALVALLLGLHQWRRRVQRSSRFRSSDKRAHQDPARGKAAGPKWPPRGRRPHR